jgi:transcription antitermination factor NusG
MNQPERLKLWYVVYTRSRSEKKVHAELTASIIESFLPLQKQLRQWNDRKRWVEVPLLTGYCFVHISKKEYLSVLQTPNVLSYVMFEKKPAVVPDRDIDYLKQMLRQSEFEVSVSSDSYHPGEKVEIIKSPLMGLQGELIKAHGKQRFILRLNSINTVFFADVPAEFLTPLPSVVY